MTHDPTETATNLDAKRQELADLMRWARPVHAIAIVVFACTGVNAMVGSLVFPDAIRPWILPACFLTCAVTIPLSFWQASLQKAIQGLEQEKQVRPGPSCATRPAGGDA